MKQTLYEWLEIAESASPEVIRGAFKFLAQKYHPDKNLQDPESAALMLREITAAFHTLSNPTARAEYDRWLKRQRFSNPDYERRRSRASGRRSGDAKRKNKTDAGGSERSDRGDRGDGVDTWV